MYDSGCQRKVPAKTSLIVRTHNIAPTYAKVRLDKGFCPCTVEPGDEFFTNGIFEFNITRLLAFVHARPERFSVEAVELADIPIYGAVCHLDQSAVEVADVLRPVLLAEISPGRFNLIDGRHRVARARHVGLVRIGAYRVLFPDHVAFLTSVQAYESYVRYWNSKLSEIA